MSIHRRCWLFILVVISVFPAATAVGQSLPAVGEDHREPFSDIPLYDLGWDSSKRPSTNVRNENGAPALATNIRPSKDSLRASEVVVKGVVNVDAIQVVRDLQSNSQGRWTDYRGYRAIPDRGDSDDDDGEPAWPKGERISTQPSQLKTITDQVWRCLAHQGFPKARFDAEFAPSEDGETVDLVISISEEGPRAVLDDVHVSGLTHHTADEVLTYLGVQKGMPLDAKLLDRIDDRLGDSCRFWTYDFAAIWPTLPDRYGIAVEATRLEIRCTEYDKVPKLDKPLSDTDQLLVKAANWFDHYGKGDAGDDLVAELLHEGAGGEPGEAAIAKMVVSPRNGWIIDLNIPDDMSDLPVLSNQCSMIIGRESAEIIHWRQEKGLRWPTRGRPRCIIDVTTTIGVEEKYKRTQGMLLALNLGEHVDENKDFQSFQFRVAPVALVHQSHLDGATAMIEGGELVMRSPDETTRYDAQTGAFREFTQVVKDGFITRVTIERDAFVKLRQQLERRAEGMELENPFANMPEAKTQEAVVEILQRWFQFTSAFFPKSFGENSDDGASKESND